MISFRLSHDSLVLSPEFSGTFGKAILEELGDLQAIVNIAKNEI